MQHGLVVENSLTIKNPFYNLLGTLSQSRLKRTFISFPLPVWKLLFDPVANIWSVVCKNPETKLTEVYMVENGKSKFLFTTTFWSGISESNYGKIIVHQFVAPERPEAIGIHVYDASNGKLLWERGELVFQSFIDADQLLAVRKNQENFQYEVLDIETGRTKNTYEADADLSHVRPPDSPVGSETKTPSASIYREGEENFEHVKKFIAKQMATDISGLVEYLETNGLIVISYYIRASNSFINECAVFDLAGNVLTKDTLAAKTDKLALNTFIVDRQTVVLIKERKEVVFYEL